MAEQTIKIPDLGGASDVDVIELLVKPGDVVEAEASIATLEGDKASMDIPTPTAGKVISVSIKVGDKVSEGDDLMVLDVQAAGDESESETNAEKAAKTKESEESEESEEAEEADVSSEQPLVVPDLGGADQVDVIEVNVAVGDEVALEQTLMTLEGDKASMEIPSTMAGSIASINVKVGDKVSEGDVIAIVKTATAPAQATSKPAASQAPSKTSQPAARAAASNQATGDVYAGPAVRRLAQELDINLNKVKGSGNKGRITKEDIKRHLSGGQAGGGSFPFKLAPLPKLDFSKFGEIETQALGKIKKATAANMARNWVGIPHVTQFDKADITEMEAFRQKQKGAAAAQGIKLTPIVFVMKAVAAALKEFPRFNSSLDANGENLILKKYVHIGVAVDTPNGLVVPVVRNVDQKSIMDLAKELGEFSQKARKSGLSLADMQGGCFTISSLGGIGGTAFTPIVNAPEVAILGLSKSEMQPVYDKASGEFNARLMLPLSLSYDHRVVDGADAARFSVFLASRLADIQTLLL